MRYLFLVGLLMPFVVCAETSLWRVSDGNAELFIGGTVHVLSQNDYPLPPEFERAYRKADVLVLETDLAAMAAPETQLKLMQRLRYLEGETLQDNLDAETYGALKAYCSGIGLPIESLHGFKPPLVAITLLMTELQRWGLADAGVDDFFNRKAKAEGKALIGLESLEQQLNTIERMGQGHENELILSTLKELRELPVIMRSMKTAWRQGDMETLEQIGITPLHMEYPALYQDLLVNRNKAWLPDIAAMLTTPERELILVGALHLAGREGVLDQLRRRGYTVERY